VSSVQTAGVTLEQTTHGFLLRDPSQNGMMLTTDDRP
jgi:hypothetical protein